MDRNPDGSVCLKLLATSLSARRAWIEISRADTAKTSNAESLSARRAWIEIIDYIIEYVNDASLSARRAWIEITPKPGKVKVVEVALRKESVDRNGQAARRVFCATGRSPQGERG